MGGREAGMIAATVLVLLMPLMVSAAGWTDIHGRNSRGEEVIFRHSRNVTVQKQGDEEAYVQHIKATIIVVKDSRERKFEDEDCLHSYRPSGDAWLTCSSAGSSPLAGPTYHQASPQRGQLSPWHCIRNCTELSPQTMKQEPWQ
jgi:hypothetical protein